MNFAPFSEDPGPDELLQAWRVEAEEIQPTAVIRSSTPLRFDWK
jgi:hypothetical protein